MGSKSIGEQGERIAAEYLTDRGYDVLHRNYRTGRLEIDIIARRGENLYFIEVKTRSCSTDSADDFMPETALTNVKKERVIRAAEQFMTQYNHTGEVFLELVAVNIVGNGHRLRHYTAAQWL